MAPTLRSQGDAPQDGGEGPRSGVSRSASTDVPVETIEEDVRSDADDQVERPRAQIISPEAQRRRDMTEPSRPFPSEDAGMAFDGDVGSQNLRHTALSTRDLIDLKHAISANKKGEVEKIEPELTGTINYREWKQSLTTVLKRRGLIRFADGSMPIPSEDDYALYKNWESLYLLTGSLIMKNVSKGIRKDLNDLSQEADIMWERLNIQFSTPSMQIMANGVQRMMYLRYSKCTGISEYLRRAESIFAEVWIDAAWSQQFEVLRSQILIAGLDTPAWNGWKTTFNATVNRSENPRSVYAYRRITNELENHYSLYLKPSRSEQNSSSAAATGTEASSSKKNARGRQDSAGQSTKPKCKHCSKAGHTEDKCWKLHPELKPLKDSSAQKPSENYATSTILSNFSRKMPSINTWVCDTASDDYIISSPHFFVPGSAKEKRLTLRMAISSKEIDAVVGNVDITLDDNTRQGCTVRFHDVIHIPGIRLNLISGIKLAEKGVIAEYRNSGMVLRRPDSSILARGDKKGKHWNLRVKKVIQYENWPSKQLPNPSADDEISQNLFTEKDHEKNHEKSPEKLSVLPQNLGQQRQMSPLNDPELSQPVDQNIAEDLPQQPYDHSVPKLDKKRVNLTTWHRRLTHAGYQAIIAASRCADGIDIKDLPVPKNPCQDCAAGKASQKIRRGPVLHRSSKAGDLIHIDLGGGGKLPRSLESNARYWLLAVDDFDGFTYIRFIRRKFHAISAVKDIIKDYENERNVQVQNLSSLTDIVDWRMPPEGAERPVFQPKTRLNDSIQAVQSDNGGEFINAQLQQWAKQRGIKWFFSAPYTHQQNGKVERAMRWVGERMRCLLSDSGLPDYMWEEAARTAVFIHNLMPNQSSRHRAEKTQVVSPYEARFGTKPDLSFLAIFGSKAYIVRQKDEIRRNPVGRHLAARAWIGYVVGYDSYHGAQYRIFRPYQDGRPGGTIHIKRDVIIDEGSDFDLYHNPDDPALSRQFQQNSKQNSTKPKLRNIDVAQPEGGDESSSATDNITEGSSDTESFDSDAESSDLSASEQDTWVQVTESSNLCPISKEDKYQINCLASSTTIAESPSTGQLQTNTVSDLPDLPSLPPLKEVDSRWLISPNSLKQAQTSPLWPWWQRAMLAEKKQLETLRSWDIVPKPKDGRVLSGKWVFKLKTDSDNVPVRFKARWVARGFMQEEGVDYHDCFAGTGRYETLRLLLVISMVLGLFMHHIDVNLAYLNAKLKETIYMDYPHTFEEEAAGKVCLLRQSLYGLKQSAANWFHTLGDFLLSRGFKRSTADPCLYSLCTDQGVVFLFIYVDDILLAASTEQLIQRVKRWITTKWSISDLGNVSYYLGLKISYDRDVGILKLSQKAYFDHLASNPACSNLTKSLTPQSTSSSIPIATELPQASESYTTLPKALKAYQSDVGTIGYGTNVSRPDLAFAWSVLSRYLTRPNDDHFSSLQQAIRYAGETSDFELTYTRAAVQISEILNQGIHNGKKEMGQLDCNDLLRGYVDASFASCPDTRRSRTGHIFFIAGGPVTWSSKRQSCVAKSSAEAEYMALSEAGSQAIWIKRLLNDMGVIRKQVTPIILRSDSKSAISLTENTRNHGRTRHIDTHWHWIRDQAQKGAIKISYVPGNTLVADGLTKPLAKPAFKAFVDMLNNGGEPAK